MSDEIHWINHAGYELRSNGVRIVHDPWIQGLAFQDGWSLVSESRYDYDQFFGVDYIWISHEHPDHFAPAVLRKIPADARSAITLLHRETRDKRIIEFCRKLGFRVQELPPGRRVLLKNGLSILCGCVADDSWSFVTTPNGSYFNANDCVGVDWSRVADTLDRPVEVLLAQFSYANWVGNPGDSANMRRSAERKLAQIDEQLAAFRPTTFIPFASYVWFCRPDNFHMNGLANRIDLVYERFKDRLRTVVLYPGDVYPLGDASFDSETAVRRYISDWNGHAEPLPTNDPSHPVEKLQQLSQAHQHALHLKNLMWMLKPLLWVGFIQSRKLFLNDLGQGLEYSMFGGILKTGLQRTDCEVELTSASFANMLSNGYGYSTLYINGRFTELRPGMFGQLGRHFAVFSQNSVGYGFPRMLFKRDYFTDHVARLSGSLRRRLRFAGGK